MNDKFTTDTTINTGTDIADDLTDKAENFSATDTLIPKKTYNNSLEALIEYVDNEANSYLYDKKFSHWTDYFKTKEGLVKIATAFSAGTVGGIGAYYFYPPAKRAADDLMRLFGMKNIIGEHIFQGFCVTGSTLLNGLLGAQCVVELAEKAKQHFKGIRNGIDAETYLLTNPSETTYQQFKRYGKYTLSAAFTLSYVTPSISLALPNTAMAILSPLANISIGAVGVHHLLFKPSAPSYKEVFLKYLQEQIRYINILYEKNPEKAKIIKSKIKNIFQKDGEITDLKKIENLENFILTLLRIGIDYSSLSEKEGEYPDEEAIVSQLLNAIGKEDNDTLELSDDLFITRDEISYTATDLNSYYSDHFINLLLHPLNSKLFSIKIYPAMTVEFMHNVHNQIALQGENYAFVPLNITYGEKETSHKNHWAALLIDKKHQLIFYLDPARKSTVPEQINTLKTFLHIFNPIILNDVIDFQAGEKDEGWIRHCGVFMIEIFKAFVKHIHQGKYISTPLEEPAVPSDSLPLLTALGEISYREINAIEKFRKLHIKNACQIVKSCTVKLDENEDESKKNLLKTSEEPEMSEKIMITPDSMKYTSVVKSESPSLPRKIFRIATPALCTIAASGYLWSSYKSIRQIPPLDTEIIAKKTGGVLIALMSAVGILGLAYRSGKNMGSNLFSGNPTLSYTISPILDVGLKTIIALLSAFSGASNFEVNKSLVNEFPLLSKIFTDNARNILAYTHAGIGIAGAPLVNYYYSTELVQEMIVFFMRFWGEEIREQIDFMRFLEKIPKILGEMNNDHFDNILKQLMENRRSPLSKQLRAIFSERLPRKSYHDFLEKFKLEALSEIKLKRYTDAEVREKLSEVNPETTGLRRRTFSSS